VAPEILSAYRQAFDGPTWGETAWEMAALDDPPMPLARLDELHHPVLVIAGDRDRVVRSEHIEAVRRHLRRHRVVTVPSCGHCPHEEHPEVVADAVIGFVADEIPSAS
jgi:pimeloyl-ACP methyl ester carboxylesterase